uniref:Uncharacterized protein n=1 Tax=Streptomyces avermitilis TaxID=33903 RepID=A0A499W982_STRAX|nr:hypothetical protein SAVMC3_86560 [Streptomyces avermitilis]
MVTVVELADLADPVDAVAAAELTAQGETGVRRIHDERARADVVGDLPNGALLGVVRVNVEVLCHLPSLCS